MKKSYRVKRDKDFQAIFDLGASVANRRFVVYHLDKGLEHIRVGLSVSKKLGNAVTRNAIKRKIRHCLMALEEGLVTEDFVIIARKGVEDLDYQAIRTNLIHVLRIGNLYQERLDSEKTV